MNHSCEEILSSTHLTEFIELLSSSACIRCALAQRSSRIVVSRGSIASKIALVGEAPGKEEDRLGVPFVGPAGELADKIFASVGIDTNKHMYITNIVKCRPTAVPGSGKENETPTTQPVQTCLPYLRRELDLLDPQLIVVAGLSALKAIGDVPKNARMGEYAGKFVRVLDKFPGFVMYHPAAILHAQKKGQEEVDRLKRLTWDHVQLLRKHIDEKGILA